MKYGHYADDDIPHFDPVPGYKTNSYGYRCLEFKPLPNGGKNVVVLGCSHTFGEGLEEAETWVSLAAKQSNKILRWWNLSRPGGNADQMIRILHGTEKVLFPKIIVACWPTWSRRERLDLYPQNLTSDNKLLRTENINTDRNNFLQNIFFLEKFAERNGAKTLHCFAEEVYDLDKNLQVLKEYTIKNCWPEWDRHHLVGAKRDIITTPNLARDGVHYGIKHHQVFAKLLLERFKSKLR
jgi:hypothetical protein